MVAPGSSGAAPIGSGQGERRICDGTSGSLWRLLANSPVLRSDDQVGVRHSARVASAFNIRQQDSRAYSRSDPEMIPRAMSVMTLGSAPRHSSVRKVHRRVPHPLACAFVIQAAVSLAGRLNVRRPPQWPTREWAERRRSDGSSRPPGLWG